MDNHGQECESFFLHEGRRAGTDHLRGTAGSESVSNQRSLSSRAWRDAWSRTRSTRVRLMWSSQSAR